MSFPMGRCGKVQDGDTQCDCIEAENNGNQNQPYPVVNAAIDVCATLSHTYSHPKQMMTLVLKSVASIVSQR